MGSMYYFAFGSNMKFEEMSTSVPGAVDAGRAELPDHQLRFSRWSTRWRAGVADAVPARGVSVWGRLYELPDDADLAGLDRREGVRSGAYRRQVAVVLQADLHVEAFMYVVVEKENVEQVPSPEYLALMLEGAAEADLPRDYRGQLRRLG